jgi:hypothetical protein
MQGDDDDKDEGEDELQAFAAEMDRMIGRLKNQRDKARAQRDDLKVQVTELKRRLKAAKD